MRVSDLAAVVASIEANKSRDEVTDEERERVITTLHHVHLPKLKRGGLVEQDDQGVISVVDSAIPENGSIAKALQFPGKVSDTKEQIFACLANERRQIIVSVLRESHQSLSLEQLGKAAVAREQDENIVEISDEIVEKTLISLHHTHLPKLADAGLLEYDPEERSIREWSPDDDLLSEKSDESQFMVIPIENSRGKEQLSLP